jgi:hypothetical protein
MPLPASGNDRLLGQKPGQNKIKSTLASSHHADSNFKNVTYKKNHNSSNSKLFKHAQRSILTEFTTYYY